MAETTVSIRDTASGDNIPVDGLIRTTAPPAPTSGQAVRQIAAIGDGSDTGNVMAVEAPGTSGSFAAAVQGVSGGVAMPIATDGAAATGFSQDAGGSGPLGWLSSAVSNLRQILLALLGTLTVAVAGTPNVSVIGTVEVDGTSEAPVGVAVPMAASYTGFGSQGLLVGVTPTQPLPVSESNAAAATTSDAPEFNVVTGDPNGDFAGVNLFEALMDDSQTFSIGTRVVNPPKMDAQRAQVQSDAPQPIVMAGVVGSVFIIDTTGYESLHFTALSASAGFSQSNDPEVAFAILYGYNAGSGNVQATIATGVSVVLPCTSRFVKVTFTVAGTITAYLRAQPFTPGVICNAPMNVAQLGGTAIVSPNFGGAIAVGGPVQSGSVSAAFPLKTAGTDTSGLIRNILTDTTGRVQTGDNGVDNAGTVRAIGMLQPGLMNIPTVAVKDLSDHEGSSQTQLLSQILTELMITNHLLYNLDPGVALRGESDPATLRNDISFAVQ